MPRFAALLFASPVLAASIPGIKNFDQVGSNVYRGGQPTTEGFQYLASIGVKTVIDLREAGERAELEGKAVTGAGMKYINIPMTGMTPPTTDEISKILDLLENPAAGPAFVHCQRGADRTGAVIAAYHIDHDKWDNARALLDAKAHSMSIFQLPRQSFIMHFQARSGSPVQPASTPATAVAAAAILTN
jgi:protein tyrosine phosphatase (PTP) superfamily phosphohydrolase (DUF442 family)